MFSNLARTRPGVRPGPAPTKQLGDVAIACTLLVITLPLMVLVAISIKCESAGPIFEGEEQVGTGGRFFRLLKFRTVMHDPERGSRVWPPQVTRVGEFLRYTRIEYLPQLINVLRGEMSLLESGSHTRFFAD